MKNLVIIAVIVIAAFLIYQQVQTSAKATIEQSDTEKQIAETAEVLTPPSLISSSPDNAAVFIMEPGDGSTVTSPVTVKFGITNMTVAPAGDNQPNSGHHHLLIDLTTLPDMTQPLPATEQIIHFGGGQTETTVELAPGEHTLQLLLGNYLHIPHDKPVLSKKITVTVE